MRLGADDASRGTGAGYSFATDRARGFSADDLLLMRAVLPVVSLAMMAYAGHTIASGLLQTYLGEDAGRRVHAGAVERGSVDAIRAVLWYADIRGFTALADAVGRSGSTGPDHRRVPGASRKRCMKTRSRQRPNLCPTSLIGARAPGPPFVDPVGTHLALVTAT